MENINLTTTELAAWVQAIGSVIAIIAAALIAIWQSREQYESGLKINKEEHRRSQTELAKSLLVLAHNCSKAAKYYTAILSDREKFHKIATGEIYQDFGELNSLIQATSNIPLYTLPSKFITHAMVLAATMRQFKHNIDPAIEFHRELDSEQFADLFKALNEMSDSLALSCKEIQKELNILNN